MSIEREISKTLKKEITLFLKQYKRMPTRTELMNRIRKIRALLHDRLLGVSRDRLERAYVLSALSTSKELGVRAELGSVDTYAIQRLMNKPILRQSFAGLTMKISSDLQDAFEKAYSKGLNIQKLRKEIEKISGLASFRAETIARTEVGKISGAARLNQYRKRPNFNNFLFKHFGPDDARTTETSKRIKARIGREGVIWDDYLRIVQEESAKDFPEWRVDPEAPLSHYQSRHNFIKVGEVS
jgi:hypothetical protein